MSDIVRSNVWRDCGQRGVKRLVMVALAGEVNTRGVAEFHHADLAAMCACPPETISAYLRQLAREGEIEYEPATGRGATCKVWMPRYGEALSSDGNPVKAVKAVKVRPAYALSASKGVKGTHASGVSDEPLAPPMAPPLVSPSLSPTPPNQTPSDPPPLNPPTPQAKTEPKGAVSGATAGRDERDRRWQPFYAAVSEGFGGLRVVNARTGSALAWVGQLAAISGRATDDDPVAAAELWRRFTEDPKFEFAGNGGDTTVAAFGKWLRMRSAAERRAAAKEEPQWLVN